MLKSCKYCNKIHDSKQECSRKPKRKKLGTDQDKFRNTKAWQRKRQEIRERDKNLCQVCLRKLHGYHRQYEYENLEVHHIIPLVEDQGRKLDNENLITICEHHHEMAERGQISRDELLHMALANEYPPTS